jgi:hypothetical protein
MEVLHRERSFPNMSLRPGFLERQHSPTPQSQGPHSPTLLSVVWRDRNERGDELTLSCPSIRVVLGETAG